MIITNEIMLDSIYGDIHMVPVISDLYILVVLMICGHCSE